MIDVFQRFWTKIEVQQNGCWDWLGSKWQGYGQIWVQGGLVKAHRYSYETYIGQISDGLEIDHLCQNPSCVNPFHLQPVTHLENLRRGNTRYHLGNWQKGKTHCPQGHPYNEANTIMHANKTHVSRQCRICNKLRCKEYYRSKQLANNLIGR